MKTLRGRPIGLTANMSTDQMYFQLCRNFSSWLQEGFTEEEIIAAIISKARPLINGYYWKRYPEARERCRKALELFLSHRGKKVSLKPKSPKPSPRSEAGKGDLFNQFFERR